MNPDDDEDYYDDYYDDEEEEEIAPKRRRSQSKEPEDSGYKNSSGANQPIDINRNRERTNTKSGNKVTPMRPSSKKQPPRDWKYVSLSQHPLRMPEKLRKRF